MKPQTNKQRREEPLRNEKHTLVPEREKPYFLIYASNEMSDQPAQSRSLIIVFIVCMKTLCYLKCAEMTMIRLRDSTCWSESCLGAHVRKWVCRRWGSVIVWFCQGLVWYCQGLVWYCKGFVWYCQGRLILPSFFFLILPRVCLILSSDCLILPRACLILPRVCLILPSSCLIFASACLILWYSQEFVWYCKRLSDIAKSASLL